MFGCSILAWVFLRGSKVPRLWSWEDNLGATINSLLFAFSDLHQFFIKAYLTLAYRLALMFSKITLRAAEFSNLNTTILQLYYNYFHTCIHTHTHTHTWTHTKWTCTQDATRLGQAAFSMLEAWVRSMGLEEMKVSVGGLSMHRCLARSCSHSTELQSCAQMHADK